LSYFSVEIIRLKIKLAATPNSIFLLVFNASKYGWQAFERNFEFFHY
jgi:hypothetical protein